LPSIEKMDRTRCDFALASKVPTKETMRLIIGTQYERRTRIVNVYDGDGVLRRDRLSST